MRYMMHLHALLLVMFLRILNQLNVTVARQVDESLPGGALKGRGPRAFRPKRRPPRSLAPGASSPSSD